MPGIGDTLDVHVPKLHGEIVELGFALWFEHVFVEAKERVRRTRWSYASQPRAPVQLLCCALALSAMVRRMRPGPPLPPASAGSFLSAGAAVPPVAMLAPSAAAGSDVGLGHLRRWYRRAPPTPRRLRCLQPGSSGSRTSAPGNPATSCPVSALVRLVGLPSPVRPPRAAPP